MTPKRRKMSRLVAARFGSDQNHLDFCAFPFGEADCEIRMFVAFSMFPLQFGNFLAGNTKSRRT